MKRMKLWLLMVCVGLAGCQSPRSAQPALQVAPFTVLKQEACLSKGDSRCYELDVQGLQTNWHWLTADLREQVVQVLQADEQAPQTDNLTQLTQAFEQGVRETLQEFPPDAASSQMMVQYQQQFIGLHGTMAMFAMSHYEYSGGAHGYGWTEYVNYDVKRRQRIHIQDMLVPGAQQALAQKLLAIYGRHEVFREDSPEEIQTFMHEWLEGWAEAFAKPDNFTFSAQGIVFSFAPYAIGPYSFGQVDLLLPYAEAEGLIQPAYLAKHD